MALAPHGIVLILVALIIGSPLLAVGQITPSTQPEDSPATQSAEEHGVESAPRTIEFAGMTWWVKDSGDGLAGPGPNRFSADGQDVWVDEQGRLHLTISQRDGQWFSTEVVTQAPTGYGEYEFRLVGPVDHIDPNAVLGLFTWDSNTWKTDANSEIDIELTRWCEAGAPNLYYSVHPGWGPDGKHPERTKAIDMTLDGDESTHVINWGPTRVTCASFQGIEPDPEKLIARWEFDDTNPPRITSNAEGETTGPIVIPKPSETTNTRINLWLVETDGDKLGDPPTDGQPIEIIVSGFRYTPAEETQAGGDPEPESGGVSDDTGE